MNIESGVFKLGAAFKFTKKNKFKTELKLTYSKRCHAVDHIFSSIRLEDFQGPMDVPKMFFYCDGQYNNDTHPELHQHPNLAAAEALNCWLLVKRSRFFCKDALKIIRFILKVYFNLNSKFAVYLNM